MLIENNRDCIIFSLYKIPTLNEFLKYFKIKGDTPISKTFERLYNYVFKGAFNLQDEYLKYYSKEYENFELFLENYYNLYEEDMKIILKEIENQNKVFYTDTSYGTKSDTSIYQLLDNVYEEQRLLGIIEKFFEEFKNEN